MYVGLGDAWARRHLPLPTISCGRDFQASRDHPFDVLSSLLLYFDLFDPVTLVKVTRAKIGAYLCKKCIDSHKTKTRMTLNNRCTFLLIAYNAAAKTRTVRDDRRQCWSDNALRHAGAVDNNGIAVCRLLNVPTRHCADVLFKVNRNVTRTNRSLVSSAHAVTTVNFQEAELFFHG